MKNYSLRIAWTIVFTMMCAPSFASTELSKVELQLLQWIDGQQKPMLDELSRHIGMNTGTSNIAGLDSYREILDEEMQKLGFATRVSSSAPIEILSCKGDRVRIADHLIASRQGSKGKRLLLNGHMDTVFEPQDAFQSLQILPDGRLKGPGIADMKGGIVVMLTALRALNHIGALEDSQLTVLLNSDEEIGSLGSRPLIEELAKQHDLGLVFEGSHKNTITRARKGLGQARLKITGRESHAGAAHNQGVSASLELAHKIIALEKLTNYEAQTTVNVGVISGGEKRNTVPGCADAYIDMRFPDESAGEALRKEIEAVAAVASTNNESYPEFPKLESWSVLHRPAKQAHPVVDQLILRLRKLSQQIGEPITGTAYSGGGTDGSIAQAVGLPTLDSLGLDGLGAHSSREESSIKSLMARSKLAAVFIYRLLKE